MTASNATAVPTGRERAGLKEGIHIELSPRRVRTYFGGQVIADSENVLLVYESRRPPVYWFPMADVRKELLTGKPQQADSDSDTIRWRLTVGDRTTDNAARSYAHPTGERAALKDHLAFYWDQMDAWFEEDEEVFVHPRDPYTRVDTVHSSRQVLVEVNGYVVADTKRAVLLYETGLPTRYYIPKQDVRMDLLEPTATSTRCPYKGVAVYWSLRLVGETLRDIVWSYPAPIPECPKIENLLSFYNDRVDLYVDGRLQGSR